MSCVMVLFSEGQGSPQVAWGPQLSTRSLSITECADPLDKVQMYGEINSSCRPIRTLIPFDHALSSSASSPFFNDLLNGSLICAELGTNLCKSLHYPKNDFS